MSQRKCHNEIRKYLEWNDSEKCYQNLRVQIKQQLEILAFNDCITTKTDWKSMSDTFILGR